MTPTTVHRQSVSATREAKGTDQGTVTISNMSEKDHGIDMRIRCGQFMRHSGTKMLNMK